MELQKCAARLVLASSCRDRGAAWSDSPSWNPQLWRPGSGSAGRSRHEALFSLRTVAPWVQSRATAAQSPECSLDPLRGAARDPSELRLTTRASIPVA